MTPEEKRKYRLLKTLAYIVAWGIEYPLRVALTIILLLPALICERKHCNEDRFCELWQKSTIKKPWCANFTPDHMCETCEHWHTCTEKNCIIDMSCDDWKLHPSLTV